MMGADRLAHLPVGSFGRHCLRTFEYPLYPRKRTAGLMATALVLFPMSSPQASALHYCARLSENRVTVRLSEALEVAIKCSPECSLEEAIREKLNNINTKKGTTSPPNTAKRDEANGCEPHAIKAIPLV